MAGSGRLIDYLGVGLASARPASLTLISGGLGIYYATDTPAVSLWDGSAWQALPSVPGSVAWGAITGTLSAQTDLQSALNAKLGIVENAVVALSISTGVVNIDCSLGSYFTLSISSDVTSITFSNLPAAGYGKTIMIKFTQDAATAHTVSFPSSFKWAGGTAGVVSTTLSAVDVLAITSFDQGTSWDATLAKAFA